MEISGCADGISRSADIGGNQLLAFKMVNSAHELPLGCSF